jgi:enoyl-CoA hydratase/carnithine racemase
MMGTRPQTLYGLADSPVGLAAWLFDHGDGYGQPAAAIISAVHRRAIDGHPAGDLTRDDVLDDFTLHWLTNTAISAARFYRELHFSLYNAANVSVPAAVSVFPGENYQARADGQSGRILSSLTSTSSARAGTLRPGNSRSSFQKRFARASDRCGRIFTRRCVMPDPSQFSTDRTYPGLWTITFSNPPINMFVPTTIVELGALMTDLEADPSVKVIVFQSANPDFFIAHLDVAKAAERPEALGFWRDFVLRLSSTPVVSIAKIRGRTRGIGNEFGLASDMRFASRQNALFGNPEVGVGLVPGAGALEWLPRLVGRSRALEIVLSGDDFDADIAERYGWVNRTLDDKDLDSFVDTLVRRLASFDRETLAAANAQVNRFGTPTATELQSSIDLFFPLLALPGAQARRDPPWTAPARAACAPKTEAVTCRLAPARETGRPG